MAYLLDSDIIIDFLKNQSQAVSVFKRIGEKELHITVVSWAEILYGIEKLSSKDKRRQELKQFLNALGIKIIVLDEEIIEKFIELKIFLEKRGEAIADFDLLIAASAIVRNLTLITRNIKHFSRIKGLKVYRHGRGSS